MVPGKTRHHSMLNVEGFIQDKYPALYQQHPRLAPQLTRFLRLVFREKAFHQFEQDYPWLRGFDFVEQVLEYFDFHYTVRDDERTRIPESGRVVIVANHPIGSLDGLALLKLVRETRPDVKVVANDLLCALEPLHSVMLPVDNRNNLTCRQHINAIRDYLSDEGAIVIFPAGEVSRLGPRGVRDGKWNPGFLRIAVHSQAPVLPVFIDGRNSILFYSVSMMLKPLSSLMLVREMFKQAQNCVDIRIGELVSYDAYQRVSLPLKEKCSLFKHHLYRTGQNKKGAFQTQRAVAHPENRARLRAEVKACELLGETADRKQIYLYYYSEDSLVMREIGRLREIAFRSVGEGTGGYRDIDRYDRNYFHLLLWDDSELEIVGAYRFCDARQPETRLYSAELFQYHEAMQPVFEQGLELGRSFVQPKYWGRRSLDYLWHGIGAFLRANDGYRYLFGPVSLSGTYPEHAMEMLVHFYAAHYPAQSNLATPNNPYIIRDDRKHALSDKFPGDDFKTEFALLKSTLSHMNLSVPTLFKQYTDVSTADGVQFAGFNIDPDFSNCVDGLIVVDLERLKPKRRRRYLEQGLIAAAA